VIELGSLSNLNGSKAYVKSRDVVFDTQRRVERNDGCKPVLLGGLALAFRPLDEQSPFANTCFGVQAHTGKARPQFMPAAS
jgi:hypothetical protein